MLRKKEQQSGIVGLGWLKEGFVFHFCFLNEVYGKAVS